MKNLSLLALFVLLSTFNGYIHAQICQPPNAIPQPTFNHVLCYDASDTVNANPSANTHYTYKWSNGATTSSITIAAIVDSTFSVTVTNTLLNCSAVFTDTIHNDPQIYNTNILNLVCSDTASANLQLDGSGGSGLLTYYLTGRSPNTTGAFPGLQAGNYTFNIVDALGCALYGGPTSLTIPATARQQTFDVNVIAGCTLNKTIVVTPITGSGLPLVYELSGGSYSSSDSFKNVAPGTYTIVVKDENGGCTDTLTAVVPPTGSIPSPTYNPAICYGLTNDTINANPNDSTDLTYLWSTGATTSYIVTGGGPFSVTITNATAACSAVFSGDITQDPQIHSSRIYDLHLCAVPPYGTATLTGEGGTGQDTYFLFGVDTNTTGYFPNLAPGNYSFAIQDSFGCRESDVFNIPPGASAETFSIEVTPATCGSIADGEIIITPTSSQVGFFEYSLNGGPAQTDTIFANVLPGKYNITITNIVAGCVYDTVAAVSAPQGDSAIVTPDSIKAGPGAVDTMSVTTTFPNAEYRWSPTTGLACDTCAVTAVTIDSSMNNKYYYVKVFTAGDSACYTTDSVLILTKIPVLFAMPNAFTPNGDNRDDFFGPASSASGFTSPTVKLFRIYNRYGQLIYNSTAPNATWDGKFKGEEQPVGTYVYYIEVQYTDPDTGKTITNKQEGAVTLLR